MSRAGAGNRNAVLFSTRLEIAFFACSGDGNRVPLLLPVALEFTVCVGVHLVAERGGAK